MKIPGFTAESSVYRTGIQYRMTARFATNSTIMRPQACNVDCYTDCLDDCRRDIGQPKLQCIRNCRIRCDCEPPPPTPTPRPPPINCGTHTCSAGQTCCAFGCCSPGQHCCEGYDIGSGTVYCCASWLTCRHLPGGIPVCSPF